MHYRGTPFAPRSPADAIAAGIGFCSEDRKLEGIVPDMSVRENLTLALLPRLARAGILDEEEQRKVVNAFIEQLRIKCTSLINKFVSFRAATSRRCSWRAGFA
jgi:monosaccharide-transporting ATPase